MKTILAVLLALAPLALAQDAPQPRAVFPDDYIAPPCTDALASCESFDQSQIAQVAVKNRGANVSQDWIDAHWNELLQALAPVCRKAGACMAQKPNDWMFCNDILEAEAVKICDRFPAKSDDATQCYFFVSAYWFGHDRTGARRTRENADCLNASAASETRTMDVWTVPAKIGPDYDGTMLVYAIDTKSHVPVQALITLEGQTIAYASDVPNGKPTTGYKMKWPLKFNRVPNAEGHQDVAAPNLIVAAEGYDTVTLPMPIDAPKMIVTMSAKLKRGRNAFVVEAKDAVTGKPVEARVMAGDFIVGDTNKPLQYEWKKGEKRPEIWVTSLFDRYDDVVVAKGQ